MKKYRIIYTSLFTLFIFLRLLKLGSHSLWVDEGFSWHTATSLNITELIKNRLAAGHFPFYFLFLKLWVNLFGTSELSLRFPSFLASVFSILFFIVLSRKILSSEKSRLLAFIIFGISPYGIELSQEARMYGMALLIFVLLITEFLKILKGETQSYKIYSLLVFLFLLNGSIALLPFVILNLYLLLNLKNQRAKKLVIINMVCFVLLSPLFYTIFTHSRFSRIESFYITHRFSPEEQLNYIYYWLLNFFSEIAGLNRVAVSILNIKFLSLSLIFILAGAYIVGVSRLNNPERSIFLFYFLLSIIPFLFSYKIESRYLFHIFPFLAICWARFLEDIKSKKIFQVIIITWGLIVCNNLYIYYTIPKSSWREIAEYLNSQTQKDEQIWLFPRFCYAVFSYYYKGKAEVVKINPANLPTTVKKDVNGIWYVHWMNASLPWVGGKHAVYVNSYIKNLLSSSLKFKDRKVFPSQRGNTEVLYFIRD